MERRSAGGFALCDERLRPAGTVGGTAAWDSPAPRYDLALEWIGILNGMLPDCTAWIVVIDDPSLED